MNVDSYTKYTDVEDNEINYENEQLVINKTPIISFVYDEVDDLETGYDVVSLEAPKAAYRIKQDIEGNFFNEILNAENESDTAITLNTGNTVNTFSQAYAALVNNGVDADNISCTVDPFVLATIGEAALGNTFKVSDEVYKRGYKGSFSNMRTYQSTNLTAYCEVALNTATTANDTLTVNGVTFTIVTSLTGTAGQVLRGASVDATRANLRSAIMGLAGAGSTYEEVTSKNRAKLEGIFAENDTTTSLEIFSKRGYKKISTNFTSANNRAGAVIINCALMEKGAIDLGLQKEVNLKVQDVQKQLSTRFMTWARYGLKTFTE